MSEPEKHSTTMNVRDGRVTSFINYIWAAFGGLGLMIGVGVNNKLSNMNDTLIFAVSKLQTQGDQIIELRAEAHKQRDEMTALRNQVYMLEGKTLRGIQEMARGH
jgi:hypothetical protein